MQYDCKKETKFTFWTSPFSIQLVNFYYIYFLDLLKFKNVNSLIILYVFENKKSMSLVVESKFIIII